ncbi:hypothetical protein GB931_11545 [Modestobacter sp. I12A-02628]|uniref:Heavy metal transporter n=1 Tax=Goekera deserti TaxID=2497753 RepID=A0A7K3WDY0_9ACTN|nr:hypothetical protein [Goekera deserti]MPQ98539.1 hypothetical protein [Goekera deserti]NDI49090.1 hypothetical protein [Goekera deserti]NEL54119.1 hypothetical protein [Goekera deserti]
MSSVRGGAPPRRAAGRPPARRPGRRVHPLVRIARAWPALLVVLGIAVALSWDTDRRDEPPVAGRCTVTDTAITLTTAQAANAATIAAVARVRGLSDRATVIALATALQESRLRNLDYGDRDSLGLFQQRPSQGWGSPEQVQDPVYSAGKFFDGLVEVRGWETGRLTEVAQSVQRSGFPEAYQQHEPVAQAVTDALLSDVPGRLSCTYSPPDATGPVDDRAAAVATVAGRELGLITTPLPEGVVRLDGGGWAAAKWAVAHAERLQLAEVRLAGWAWTPGDGWAESAAAGPQLTVTLAT